MNDFDKIIQSKFNHYPSPGYEHLWDSVEERIRKPRRRIAWILLTGLVCLLTALVFLLNPPLQESQSLASNPGVNSSAISNTISISTPTSTSTPTHAHTPTSTSTSISTSTPTYTPTFIHTPTHTSTSTSTSIHTSTPTSIHIFTHTPISTPTSTSISTYNPLSPVPFLNATRKPSISDSKELTFKKAIPDPLNIPLLDRPDLPFSFTRNITFTTDPKYCPTFSKEIRKPTLDVYYNQFLPLNRLSNLDMENNDYLNLRDLTESSVYSFGAGVRYNLYLTPSLSVKAGLDYSRIREKFRYSDPTTQQVRTIITIDTLFTQGGPVVTSDTSIIRIPGSRDIQEVNEIRRFSAPLQFGYEMQYQDFNISWNAGIIMTFITRSEGAILDPSDTPVYYNHSDQANYPLFHEDIQWSLTGSITLETKELNGFSLFLEPHIRYDLNNLATDSYPLSQKYLNIGVLSGIRIPF